MGIVVENPGVLTTIQDKGRYGYEQFGVSPSGPMDLESFQIANILVGNSRVIVPTGSISIDLCFGSGTMISSYIDSPDKGLSDYLGGRIDNLDEIFILLSGNKKAPRRTVIKTG